MLNWRDRSSFSFYGWSKGVGYIKKWLLVYSYVELSANIDLIVLIVLIISNQPEDIAKTAIYYVFKMNKYSILSFAFQMNSRKLIKVKVHGVLKAYWKMILHSVLECVI